MGDDGSRVGDDGGRVGDGSGLGNDDGSGVGDDGDGVGDNGGGGVGDCGGNYSLHVEHCMYVGWGCILNCEFYAIIPTLFPCFLLICYLYIL